MSNGTSYWVTFTGPVQWAKTMRPDQKYGYYGLEMQLDAEQLAKWEKIGLGSKAKKDGWVAFKRKPVIISVKTGKTHEFGPPKVQDQNGSPITDLIGNGSLCTVDVCVYSTEKGPGHRLDTVWVHNLIKYEAKPRFVNNPDGTLSVTPKMPF